MSDTSDFIIVGGGLAGSVLASRLSKKEPTSSITVIEAGPEVSGHPLTTFPLDCFNAHFSSLDWAYTTVPQRHLDQRACYNSAGKALGGGTAVNYGVWTRGPREDYDEWAKLVGDPRWSYNSMLPYFKKVEHHFAKDEEGSDYHGFEGPIHTASVPHSSSKRVYPLREPIKQAWERLGVEAIADMNNGSPRGLADSIENWREGKRQIASNAYGLLGKSNLHVMTETLVHRVLIETREHNSVAVGVELVGGKQIRANREVILACGAYRTPQVLLLSGIGPTAELLRHDIFQYSELPVGMNLHDHMAVSQFWKLKEPEKGLAAGTPLWTDSAYLLGLGKDWLVTTSAPTDQLKAALEKDDDKSNASLLDASRCHIETIMAYGPAGAALSGTPVPQDGTYIATVVLGMQPTSRGSISLASKNPLDAPLIDPNYYATEFDKVTLRFGLRQAMKLMLKTPEGQAMVSEEMPPPGYPTIEHGSSDAQIDARVRRVGNTFFHPAGSAAMGTVVDSELRVKGIDKLRVVDASVLPLSICAHYQVVTYALAEQAADIISRA